MFTSNHFQHQMVSQCWMSLQFYRDLIVLFLLADVIAIVVYQILAGCCCQFLLTKVGRWYCHLVVVNLKPLVLVVLWADVIALYHLWQMLCHFRYRVWLIVVTCCLWLMLLSHYCLSFGRCYAMWCATTFCCKRAFTCPWLMLLPFVICLLGWCHCLLF